jgi:hypothetical protein
MAVKKKTVASKAPAKKSASTKSRAPAKTAAKKRKPAAKKKPAARKRGRPTIMTKEITERICREIVEGKSVKKICESEDLPNVSQVYRWLEKSAEFRDQYARARELQADFCADRIAEIASESPRLIGDDNRIDNGYVQWQRLRVDAEKWRASKLAPKRYGDKPTQDVDETGRGIDQNWRVTVVHTTAESYHESIKHQKESKKDQ